MADFNYNQKSSIESYTNHGAVGVKILVSCERKLSAEEGFEINRLTEQISHVILRGNIQADPEEMARAEQETKNLVDCFPVHNLVFVEKIPNGYCSRYCCEHKPWLIVTTPRGRIKIGWRKSVINIDWSDSPIKSTADDLFDIEDVTKSGRSIHAHGYDKARAYLKKLLEEG